MAALNPAPTAEKSEWERILDDFLPERLISREEKQAGAVLIREYDAQRGYAVWTKVYENRPHSLNLSVFNEWEKLLVERLRHAQVARCYQLVEAKIEGTQLHQPSQTTLRTRHAGPDLNRLARHWNAERKDWDYLTLASGNGEAITHPLVAPANFLRLARGMLLALEQLHQKSEGFVHCDLNPGNWAVPLLQVEIIGAPRGEALRLRPDWDNPKLIDFGYSLCRAMRPLTTLPLRPSAPHLSEHLRQRLNRIEAEGRRHDSGGWDSQRFDKGFWSRWHGNPLHHLLDIDWREDIHQLGFLLAEIRDEWGGGEHVTRARHSQRINAVIWELPEQMKSYGTAERVGQVAPAMPHRDWIQAIDAALTEAGETDGFADMLLYRADYDMAYAKRWACPQSRREHMRKLRGLVACMVLLLGGSGVSLWTWWQTHHPPLLSQRAEYEAFKSSAAFQQWWYSGEGKPPAGLLHWHELGLALARQGDDRAALEQAELEWDGLGGLAPDPGAARRLLEAHRAGLQALAKQGTFAWQTAAREALGRLGR